jgi:hypothetical protein
MFQRNGERECENTPLTTQTRFYPNVTIVRFWRLLPLLDRHCFALPAGPFTVDIHS